MDEIGRGDEEDEREGGEESELETSGGHKEIWGVKGTRGWGFGMDRGRRRRGKRWPDRGRTGEGRGGGEGAGVGSGETWRTQAKGRPRGIRNGKGRRGRKGRGGRRGR